MNKRIAILLLCLVLTACGVRGYELTNIAYTTSADMLTSVAFDLDQPADAVYVRMSISGALQKCESAEPFTHWTCPLEGVVSAKVEGMSVVVK